MLHDTERAKGILVALTLVLIIGFCVPTHSIPVPSQVEVITYPVKQRTRDDQVDTHLLCVLIKEADGVSLCEKAWHRSCRRNDLLRCFQC